MNETRKTGPAFRFIDLFAGIGGFRMALEQAGGRCVFSSEIDAFSRRTYAANFGEEPAGDIKEVDARTIPDHEILAGGFPCQPFSIAGVSKKGSLGREHGFKDLTQGTLFFDIARILTEKKPPVLFLENVKNLKSHDKGRTFSIILSTLQELGYTVFHSVLDARYYVPQHRERIYLVGFHKDAFERPPFFRFPEPPSRRPILADILQEDESLGDYTISDRLWQWHRDYAAKHKSQGNGFGYGLVKGADCTRTLSARYYKDGAEILVRQENANPRKLTPRECARLMGFPDSFKIPVSNTQAYRQFGNSVVVPLIADMVKKLEMLLPFQNLPGRFEGDESIAGACLQSDGFFFKFLSANETGATGSHQAGFYIHRQAYWLFFPQPGKKGENSFRDIEIEWADGTVTSSKFTWYGKGNKSEYRITKGLHFLGEENTGDLLVLARKTDGFFKGFLLAQENSIEAFLDELSLNPSHSGQAFRIAGGTIQAEEEQSELNGFEQSLNEALQDCLQNPDSPFPTADRLSSLARAQCDLFYRMDRMSLDDRLLRWLDMEFRIFRWLESRKYGEYLNHGFAVVEDLIQVALTILNRRKSRAGYGLELHLAHLFEMAGIAFSAQPKIEGNKRPDFLFPGDAEYSDPNFPAQRLTFLGVKTTCKDRWRQILSEADRIGLKHLFTLQQGISKTQMNEMKEAGVQLVVPRPYHRMFPEHLRKDLMDLESFVNYVRSLDSQELLFG